MDIFLVPEPASIFLLGIGLMGLAGFGRKFFKKYHPVNLILPDNESRELLILLDFIHSHKISIWIKVYPSYSNWTTLTFSGAGYDLCRQRKKIELDGIGAVPSAGPVPPLFLLSMTGVAGLFTVRKKFANR